MDDAYGHIEGASRIPLPELGARVSEPEAWKDKPITVVCTAWGFLGIRRVFNLDGGLIAGRESEHR